MKKIRTVFMTAFITVILGLTASGSFDFSLSVPEECRTVFKRALYTVYKAEEKETEENNNYVEGTRHAKAVPDIDENDTSTDFFFENSVFAGDSLMDGFRLYCLNKGEGFLSGPLFLAETSLSVHRLLMPVTETSKHPYYMGEKLLLEDAVAKSGAEKVFLNFGTNDLVSFSPEQVLKEYNDLIYRIHKKSPDVKIYLIGLTYIAPSAQKPGFTNENMRKFNDALYKYCGNYDYLEFINIGDRLIDAADGLKEEYCSDGYVHMTQEGYKVWVKVLRAYAEFLSAE